MAGLSQKKEKKRIGFLINPFAGIGGKVGLKGSDGEEIVQRAFSLGAVPEAPRRAKEALMKIKPVAGGIELLTWSGAMGEDAAREAGFTPTVVGAAQQAFTTPRDTEIAAACMADAAVDLLLFAGGDGTARNIFHAVADRLPVLGIPAGVKIHSAVYATCPANAGLLALKFLSRKGKPRLEDAEVMDIDEEAFRNNRLSARLFGYMKTPYDSLLIQSAKAGSRSSDEIALDGISSDILYNMSDAHVYIIGSGTTPRAIMNKLGLPNTLLGVDAVFRKKLIGSDLNETLLLNILANQKAKIVVTVIGGQGHVFGRGNQQISPEVIRRVGKENIVIAATEAKILALKGKPLRVDTGDAGVDAMLKGYARVVVGLHKRLVCRIA